MKNMRLDEYPRPVEDNGIGIHFGLDLRQTSLDTFTAKMIELRVKWCLVSHGDELDLGRAAMVIGSAGILPVSRWICHIDQNILDFMRFVKVLTNLNLPAYIQIFNEPSDGREWRDGVPKPRVFVARWCDHAARVADAGGFPGLQVLDVDELRSVLAELKARRAAKVIDRMWFCPHPYGANHPPDYPYDVRNQYDHPGATVMTDDIAVLQFLVFAPVFQEELGFIPPFIAGEGGWQYRNAEDGRYAKVDDAAHARYHAALFNWFRTGLLSNGDALPEYLFTICPWILYGYEADAWYSWTTGTRQQTIDAVKAIPEFVRRTGGAEAPQLAAKPIQILSHYMLFGAATPAQRARLVLARDYLTRFSIPFGFSVDEAAHAKQVTIVGDQSVVSAEEEANLKGAGCRIERLLGDAYALRIILADRLTREAEFG
jgi:hypothetical protein